ncbi:MAG: phosphoribosylanthranilate isomerase [Acidimicrobiia bacterium]
MRTWVKLCGMRSADDVAAAAAAGADAVGFVTAARSMRSVTPLQAAEFGSGTALATFLVTEDESPEALLRAAAEASVTGVQPHGRHSLAAATAALSAGLEVLFPISVVPGVDFDGTPVGGLPLLDAPTWGGGVGFDHSLIPQGLGRFVLAGGLRASNVAEAVRTVRPYGVDVSSGIEREPGVKDPQLMREFVGAAR